MEGQIKLTFFPGLVDLDIGGANEPHPLQPQTFYVPEHFKRELPRGANERIQVRLRRGGWLLITGELPGRINGATCTQGEVTRTVSGSRGTWGQPKVGGTFLGALDTGTWQIRFTIDKKTYTRDVEIKAGEVAQIPIDNFKATEAK